MQKKFATGGVIALTAAMVFSGCQQAAPAPQKAPEEVVKDGMKKLTSVTSHEFELVLNGDLKGPQGEKPEKVKFDLNLSGSADMKDTKDPKINLKFDGSGNGDDQGASAKAELRLNKEALYFTLAKLDVKGGEAVPKEFMDMYAGKWWKLPIPPESLKELTASLPEGGSQENMTPEQKEMKELFENTQFFKNIKYVGTEDVKGESSYHYTAELDKDAFATFAAKAAEKQGKSMTASEQQEMKEGMKKVDFTGNVWVGTTSGVMNQVSGDIKLVNTTASEPTGTVSMRVSMWNFNKPVTVTAPADAQDFPVEQLMGAMLGGSAMGGVSMDGSMMDAGSTESSTSSTTGDAMMGE